jgi:hypothetical protein
MPSFRSVVLALSMIPAYVAAQEVQETNDFHAGQWALQFGAGGSFGLASIGILKFTSSRSAWMLRFDVDGEFLKGQTTDASGTSSNSKDHFVFFATGFGKRFYQAPRQKVRSFQSIGVIGSYSNQQTERSGSGFTFRRWAAGLLGELGAGYWVTPSLSLGGTANLSAGYSDRHEVNGLNTTGQITTNESGWFVSGVDVRLIIGLYF